MPYPKRRLSPDIDNTFGKVPPQCVDLEEAVLGALLIQNNLIVSLSKFLQPKHFYKEQHNIIYQAILDLYEKGSPIDTLLVTNYLQTKNLLDQCGGAFYIAQLTNKISSSANSGAHCLVIIERYILRELIRVSSETINKAFTLDDPFELITDLRLQLDELDNYTNAVITKTTKTAVELTFKQMNEVVKGVTTYYETGYPMFDEKVSISPNEILMIAGPAGHGKTKLAIALIFKLLFLHKDISVDWYSFEDPMDKIIRCRIASLTGFTDKYMRGKTRKKITKEDLEIMNNIRSQILHYDIEFHEDPMYAKDIKYSFTRFCEKRPGRFCICVIDNLLLVMDKGKGTERDDNILAEISRTRQATKGLIIPIHHFSDEQQSSDRARLAYRPRLKDMKGSEAYRRVPTQILLVNKPGEYTDVIKLYPDRPEMKHLFITDLAKNRDGDTTIGDEKGIIRWFANLDFNVFYEY